MVNATPRPLYLRERPGTHCKGGWVGPTAGLERCGKYHPPPGFDPWAVQTAASRYTDRGIQTPWTEKHENEHEKPKVNLKKIQNLQIIREMLNFRKMRESWQNFTVHPVRTCEQNVRHTKTHRQLEVKEGIEGNYSLISTKTISHFPKIGGASTTSFSQIRASAMFSLLPVGNLKVRQWKVLQQNKMYLLSCFSSLIMNPCPWTPVSLTGITYVPSFAKIGHIKVYRHADSIEISMYSPPPLIMIWYIFNCNWVATMKINGNFLSDVLNLTHIKCCERYLICSGLHGYCVVKNR